MQTGKILGITVTLRSLREALNHSEYLCKSIPFSTIHYLTTRMLIHASKHQETKTLLENTNIHICAETDILKAAGINSSARQYETENNLFLKELCRRTHRNNDSIYIISENADKLQVLTQMLNEYIGEEYKSASLVLDVLRDADGLLNLEALANKLNDFAPHIIISNLAFPYQLQLMNELKPFLNARIWLGLPDEAAFYKRNKFPLLSFTGIWRKYFRKKVVQYRKPFDEDNPYE